MRAEARFDGGVAAGRGADGPRAAGIAGRRRQRVVAPFAMRLADWMDRRQIDHIESHVGDVRQPRFGFAERAAARRIRRHGARKHLVPRAESRADGIDDAREHALVDGRGAAIRPRVHQRAQRRILAPPRRARPAARRCAGCRRFRAGGDRRVCAVRTPFGEPWQGDGLDRTARLNQLRALEQLARDVLAGIGFRDQAFQPRSEAIDPRFDRVFVLAKLGDRERRVPAIVVAR